jgi:hypothetical protein
MPIFTKMIILTLLFPLIGAEDDFYSLDKEVGLLSNELLQGKFTFNKKLKEIKYIARFLFKNFENIKITIKRYIMYY